MSASRPGFCAAGSAASGACSTARRRLLLNLLFLALIAALVWAFVHARPAAAAGQDRAGARTCAARWSSSAAASWRDSALGRVRGEAEQQVQLRDVLDVLDAAAKDPQITQALLVLDDFQGAGLPTLRELAAALQRFKASGKPVVAWGSQLSTSASTTSPRAASEVLLHPMGMVLDGRLRPLPQLLPRRARQARRDGQPDPRRHLQELRRALHRERPVAGRYRGRELAQQRAVDHLHRRRSSARASCPPAAWRAASTSCRSAWPRRAATWPSWRSTPSWWMR